MASECRESLGDFSVWKNSLKMSLEGFFVVEVCGGMTVANERGLLHGGGPRIEEAVGSGETISWVRFGAFSWDESVVETSVELSADKFGVTLSFCASSCKFSMMC